MITVFLYQIKATVPDPREAGRYFTLDGVTVTTDQPLNSGFNFDGLLRALADSVRDKTGVPVSPSGFNVERIELVGSREVESF